jgi:hypothetical protein
MSKYDIYENGYQNGIIFGYIPELNKEEMRAGTSIKPH